MIRSSILIVVLCCAAVYSAPTENNKYVLDKLVGEKMEVATILETVEQMNRLINHIYLHKHLIPHQLIALLSEFGPFWRGVFGIPAPTTTTTETRGDDEGGDETWDLNMPTQPRIVRGGFNGLLKPQVEILPVTTPPK